MRAVSRHLSSVLLLAFGAALLAACGDGKPRALPFPRLDARMPFPELAARPDEAAASPARRTSFVDRLAPAAAPVPAQESAAPRLVPLGAQLSGAIPSTPLWSWQQVDGGITLIACRPGGGRPAALVYAEGFTARMRTAPSEEIQRFQLTVNPEGNERRLTPSAAAGALNSGLIHQVARETGGGRTEAARLLQLLTTRTAGAGIGFHPAAGSFTGWKWVGKNEQGMTVRLGRFTGIWEPRAALPAEIAQRLEALQKIPAVSAAAAQLRVSSASPGAIGAGGVSAYLLVGGATDDEEQAGAHLAILWQHSPDLPCVEGLAAFLASLRTAGSPVPGEPGESDGQASDVQDAAGLQLLPADTLLRLEQLRAPAAQRPAPGTTAPPTSTGVPLR